MITTSLEKVNWTYQHRRFDPVDVEFEIRVTA